MAFQLTAQLNLVGPANIRPVIAGIQKQLQSGLQANVRVRVDRNAQAQVNNLTTSIQKLNASASGASGGTQKLTSSTAALSGSMSAASKTSAAAAAGMAGVGGSAMKTAAQTKMATSSMHEFGRVSGLALRRFAGFTIATTVVFGFIRAISEAVQEAVSFERQMMRIAQVSNSTVAGMSKLSNEIDRVSVKLGVASKDLVEMSLILKQSGLSARDTKVALEALAKTTLAPTFTDIKKTAEGAIAAMRQFDIQADQLEATLGSINAIAGKFAVEADDIISVIRRAGGVFAAASEGIGTPIGKLQELAAIFTSVRATTRESADSIATGLRTIFTRIQRGQTVNFLREYGVELLDLQGNFVGTYEAFRRLSAGLKQIPTRSGEFAKIVEELGGFRQVGKLIPAIKQFGTAEKARQAAIKGSASLTKDAEQAQKTLAVQLMKVREEFTLMMREMTKTGTFQNMASMVLKLASAFIKVADAMKDFLPMLTSLMAVKGIMMLKQFGGGFFGGLKSVAGEGTAGQGGAITQKIAGGTGAAAAGRGLAGVRGGVISTGTGAAEAAPMKALVKIAGILQKSIVANTGSMQALGAALKLNSAEIVIMRASNHNLLKANRFVHTALGSNTVATGANTVAIESSTKTLVASIERLILALQARGGGAGGMLPVAAGAKGKRPVPGIQPGQASGVGGAVLPPAVPVDSLRFGVGQGSGSFGMGTGFARQSGPIPGSPRGSTPSWVNQLPDNREAVIARNRSGGGIVPGVRGTTSGSNLSGKPMSMDAANRMLGGARRSDVMPVDTRVLKDSSEKTNRLRQTTTKNIKRLNGELNTLGTRTQNASHWSGIQNAAVKSVTASMNTAGGATKLAGRGIALLGRGLGMAVTGLRGFAKKLQGMFGAGGGMGGMFMAMMIAPMISQALDKDRFSKQTRAGGAAAGSGIMAGAMAGMMGLGLKGGLLIGGLVAATTYFKKLGELETAESLEKLDRASTKVRDSFGELQNQIAEGNTVALHRFQDSLGTALKAGEDYANTLSNNSATQVAVFGAATGAAIGDMFEAFGRITAGRGLLGGTSGLFGSGRSTGPQGGTLGAFGRQGLDQGALMSQAAVGAGGPFMAMITGMFKGEAGLQEAAKGGRAEIARKGAEAAKEYQANAEKAFHSAVVGGNTMKEMGIATADSSKLTAGQIKMLRALNSTDQETIRIMLRMKAEGKSLNEIRQFEIAQAQERAKILFEQATETREANQATSKAIAKMNLLNMAMADMAGAIERAGEDAKGAKESILGLFASLSGMSKVQGPAAAQENVKILKDIRNSTPGEIASAVAQTTGMMGGGPAAGMMDTGIKVSKKLETILPTFVQTLASLNAEDRAQAIRNAFKGGGALDFLPKEMQGALEQSLQKVLGEGTRQGLTAGQIAQDPEKIGQIIGNTTENALAPALAAWNAIAAGRKNLIDVLNKTAQIHQKVGKLYDKGAKIQQNTNISIAKAVGRFEDMSLSEMTSAFTQGMERKTGLQGPAASNPLVIAQQIQNLEGRRRDLESQIASGQLTEDEITTIQIEELNPVINALNDNKKALDQLATDTSRLQAVQTKLAQFEQKKQAQRGILERLATAGPEELQKISEEINAGLAAQATGRISASGGRARQQLAGLTSLNQLAGGGTGGGRDDFFRLLGRGGGNVASRLGGAMPGVLGGAFAGKGGSAVEQGLIGEMKRLGDIQKLATDMQIEIMETGMDELVFQARTAFNTMVSDVQNMADKVAFEFQTTGVTTGMARGGVVPGVGNRDTVPASLTPGEFVIKKSSVNKVGTDALHAINAQGFADGGGVKKNLWDPLKVILGAGGSTKRMPSGKQQWDEDIERWKQLGSGAKKNVGDPLMTILRAGSSTKRMPSGKQQWDEDIARWKGIGRGIGKGAHEVGRTAVGFDLMLQDFLGIHGSRSKAAGFGAKTPKPTVGPPRLGGQVTQELLDSLTDKEKEALGVPFAAGGTAKGTDTVPAMLTPGEFVINKNAASKNRGLLHKINSGHKMALGGPVQYFAAGGNVTRPTGAFNAEEKKKQKEIDAERARLKNEERAGGYGDTPAILSIEKSKKKTKEVLLMWEELKKKRENPVMIPSLTRTPAHPGGKFGGRFSGGFDPTTGTADPATLASYDAASQKYKERGEKIEKEIARQNKRIKDQEDKILDLRSQGALQSSGISPSAMSNLSKVAGTVDDKGKLIKNDPALIALYDYFKFQGNITPLLPTFAPKGKSSKGSSSANVALEKQVKGDLQALKGKNLTKGDASFKAWIKGKKYGRHTIQVPVLNRFTASGDAEMHKEQGEAGYFSPSAPWAKSFQSFVAQHKSNPPPEMVKTFIQEGLIPAQEAMDEEGKKANAALVGKELERMIIGHRSVSPHVMSILYTSYAKNLKEDIRQKHEANVAAQSNQDQVEQQLWHDVQARQDRKNEFADKLFKSGHRQFFKQAEKTSPGLAPGTTKITPEKYWEIYPPLIKDDTGAWVAHPRWKEQEPTVLNAKKALSKEAFFGLKPTPVKGRLTAADMGTPMAMTTAKLTGILGGGYLPPWLHNWFVGAGTLHPGAVQLVDPANPRKGSSHPAGLSILSRFIGAVKSAGEGKYEKDLMSMGKAEAREADILGGAPDQVEAALQQEQKAAAESFGAVVRRRVIASNPKLAAKEKRKEKYRAQNAEKLKQKLYKRFLSTPGASGKIDGPEFEAWMKQRQSPQQAVGGEALTAPGVPKDYAGISEVETIYKMNQFLATPRGRKLAKDKGIMGWYSYPPPVQPSSGTTGETKLAPLEDKTKMDFAKAYLRVARAKQKGLDIDPYSILPRSTRESQASDMTGRRKALGKEGLAFSKIAKANLSSYVYAKATSFNTGPLVRSRQQAENQIGEAPKSAARANREAAMEAGSMIDPQRVSGILAAFFRGKYGAGEAIDRLIGLSKGVGGAGAGDWLRTSQGQLPDLGSPNLWEKDLVSSVVQGINEPADSEIQAMEQKIDAARVGEVSLQGMDAIQKFMLEAWYAGKNLEAQMQSQGALKVAWQQLIASDRHIWERKGRRDTSPGSGHPGADRTNVDVRRGLEFMGEQNALWSWPSTRGMGGIGDDVGQPSWFVNVGQNDLALEKLKGGGDPAFAAEISDEVREMRLARLRAAWQKFFPLFFSTDGSGVGASTLTTPAWDALELAGGSDSGILAWGAGLGDKASVALEGQKEWESFNYGGTFDFNQALKIPVKDQAFQTGHPDNPPANQETKGQAALDAVVSGARFRDSTFNDELYGDWEGLRDRFPEIWKQAAQDTKLRSDYVSGHRQRMIETWMERMDELNKGFKPGYDSLGAETGALATLRRLALGDDWKSIEELYSEDVLQGKTGTQLDKDAGDRFGRAMKEDAFFKFFLRPTAEGMAKKRALVSGGGISSTPQGGSGNYFAEGGWVGSSSSKGTTDTIPAMLTAGEYVVNRQAAQQNRGLLESINNGDSRFRAKGVTRRGARQGLQTGGGAGGTSIEAANIIKGAMTTFGSWVQQLKDWNPPPIYHEHGSIQMTGKVDVAVSVTGGTEFAKLMEGSIKDYVNEVIEAEIGKKMNSVTGETRDSMEKGGGILKRLKARRRG